MAKTLVTQERDAILQEMTAPLREVYDKILDEVTSLNDANIMARYRIGQHVAAVTGNERKYGEAAVSSLAAALGGKVNEQDLWKFRSLANTYTPELLKKILQKRMPDGGQITFSHLVVLTDLAPRVRSEMLNRIFKEGLTTDELGAALQLKLGKRGKGGRKAQLPKTIGAGLSQMDKICGEIDKRLDLWDKAVFKRIAEASSDDITPDTLKQIHSVQKQVSTMAQDATKLTSELEQAEARAKRVLAAKKEEAATAQKTAKKTTAKKTTAKKTTAKKKAPGGSAQDRIARAKAKKGAKKTDKKRVARPATV